MVHFCPVPSCHGCVLVVPAQPDFFKRLRGDKRAVDLRGSPAQLPDLVETRRKASNALHVHLVSEL
jgi:hypothetical protein